MEVDIKTGEAELSWHVKVALHQQVFEFKSFLLHNVGMHYSHQVVLSSLY